MASVTTITAIVVLVLIIIVGILSKYYFGRDAFYSIDELFPEHRSIHQIRPQVLEETKRILSDADNWKFWPEKDLYDGPPRSDWKIFPFYAFGVWVDDNCKQAPAITAFIRSIPNLKLAILSKLSPGMKLKPHRGWGNYSNHVLRSHYGVIIPEGCYIKVNDKVQYHKDDEWIVFDDSEMHMVENPSDTERIVLIIDRERPKHIPLGTSTIGDTEELANIIEYFRARSRPPRKSLRLARKLTSHQDLAFTTS
jgi:beta-hydroxylase